MSKTSTPADKAAATDGARPGGDFNGADPARFDHDGDGNPGGSQAKTKTYLVVEPTADYGPRGRFLELTADAAKPGLADKVIAEPTADQLAQRPVANGHPV